MSNSVKIGKRIVVCEVTAVRGGPCRWEAEDS